MLHKVHTFSLALDFGLINKLSGIDRFGGSWIAIEKREGYQSLKQLKSIATVYSVGSSTRIEGSRMTNQEVGALIFDNLKQEKLEERDQQEVVGYFNALDIISESYQDISISENSLKNIHNILLKYSEKDQWHRGNYKQHSNSVDATNLDGIKTTIFQTTPPGIETEDAMRALVDWYNNDLSTPPIIRSALFVYDFLSIHPFQDGNGRLSRLLGTLLLLKHGYSWIQYVSFEHEIEKQKSEYYRVLMDCQKQRPGENITPWVIFFMECLGNIQQKLMQKLDVQKNENQLSAKERMIYTFIESHPGCQSGEISTKLNLPLPTVKKILADMTGTFITKHGIGKGTNYTAEKITRVKSNVALTLTEAQFEKEFILKDKHSFLEIKKIILTPKFHWTKSEDWITRLLIDNLLLTIRCFNNKGEIKGLPYALTSFSNPFYFEPVFTLNNPIHIPESVWVETPEFPIKAVLTLSGASTNFQFDVTLVYDAALN